MDRTRKAGTGAAAKRRISANATFERIALPRPTPFGGVVVTALRKRRTVRSFSDRKLSRQMLSNLLW